MMWCWCSSLCMYICRRAWRSPFNINDVLDSSLTPQWCFGSIFDTSMMFVDLYLMSSDGLDLWCQFLTSEVPLVAKNSISTFWCTLGKYCTHLMSGLGSGMPKSVTLVTQVTVNFWAHVSGCLIVSSRGMKAVLGIGSKPPHVTWWWRFCDWKELNSAYNHS